MLPLANKPILEHIIQQVATAGVKELAIVIGYRDDVIKDYFADGTAWGVKINYYIQRQQNGTAGALAMVSDYCDGKFIVINGDILVESKDIEQISTMDGNTLTVTRVHNTEGMGVITLEDGKVKNIYEKTDKPPSKIINAGIYLFTPEIFRYLKATPLSQRGEYELTDSIQTMINEGITMNCIELSKWFNLSYPWTLLDANEELLSGLKGKTIGTIEEGARIHGEVYIGNNTVVKSGSYIVGPVKIGDNCNIGPNCYIRPSTSIADNCHVGAAVEIKNSIIMSGSKLPHHNYVGDSIIGQNCNMGAGSIIANLRLDKDTIRIDGIDTGRRKLGAIIGDNVETGINSSINVGTMIGNGVLIGPGTLVSGIVAPGSKVY